MKLPVRLHGLKRSLANQCAMIPWAATCYATLFGLLIYSLAVEARLESWRRSSTQTVASIQRAALTLSAVNASCAELAGMGQKLCNAETKVDAARAKFQQRVAARKQRHARSPAVRVKRAQNTPAQTPVQPAQTSAPPANSPDQAEPLNSSIAIRE
jgi:hypothetical protein